MLFHYVVGSRIREGVEDHGRCGLKVLESLQGEGSEYYGGTNHRRLAHVRACSHIVMTRNEEEEKQEEKNKKEIFECHKLDTEVCHILLSV